MERQIQVLICDDDATFHLAIKHALKGKFSCRSAYDSDEALAILKNQPTDVLLLDVQMRTENEGLEAIPKMKEIDPELPIIMSSGRTDFVTVREAMKLGASDYVPKDFDPNDLILTIYGVLDRRQLLVRQGQQNFEAMSLQRQHVLVGTSKVMRQLEKMLERMRQSPANVVITGETGSGKEMVARNLRKTLSDGSLEPFVAIDSSTIQSSTAESILFGHEKGAFTGADKLTKGIFEEADGGIVYFDEIGNMPLDIQAKLLRVLQEKEVSRLGSSRAIQLDFRVVCATNKDLEQMVRDGMFKDDLLQRLSVLPVHIPPLRERPEDVPALAEHFAHKQRGPISFSAEALETLQRYPWPGNVRELANLVAYLACMVESPKIDVSDLPPKIRDVTRGFSKESSGTSYYEKISAYEREVLASEYQKAEGNVSQLALSLGMDRSHLYTKLREFGLHQKR